MPNNINSQIQFLSGRYLNNIHDAVAGGSAASGTGAAQILGQLGQKMELSEEDTARLSDPAIGTLHAGEFQYVLTDDDAVQTPARGLVAYWNDEATYEVTPDLAGGGCIAGLYLSAQVAGEYHFIQRGGVGSVKFKDGITKTSPVACDLVVSVAEASVGVADVLADATAITSVIAKTILGVAAVAPTAGAISTIEMWERFRNS